VRNKRADRRNTNLRGNKSSQSVDQSEDVNESEQTTESIIRSLLDKQK
jgi:hypothetical protein